MLHPSLLTLVNRALLCNLEQFDAIHHVRTRHSGVTKLHRDRGRLFRGSAAQLSRAAISASVMEPIIMRMGLRQSLPTKFGGLFADLAELIAPQGRLALINGEAADVSVFMRKSVSVHYELMFTRPLFQTADIEARHRLLERDHLEDDAHRPLVHFWTGLRRHAKRGQSQEQPLCEQGLQNGVRASATALKTAPPPPSKWKWIVVGPTPSALASLRRLAVNFGVSWS